jgi:hypothetical protein
MSSQRIADITDLLFQIAEAIDEPPTTPALEHLIGRKLTLSFEKMGRIGIVGGLIAHDPTSIHTTVELRVLGDHLFRLGRRLGPGSGIKTMAEALAEVVRRRNGSKGQSFDIINAAWSGIGMSDNDGGWPK